MQRRIKQARFPTVKSLDSFDFLAIPSLNKPLVLDLALIVRRRRDGPETAHPVRVVPAQTLSQVLWSAGLLLPRTEETTP